MVLDGPLNVLRDVLERGSVLLHDIVAQGNAVAGVWGRGRGWQLMGTLSITQTKGHALRMDCSANYPFWPIVDISIMVSP